MFSTELVYLKETCEAGRQQKIPYSFPQKKDTIENQEF